MKKPPRGKGKKSGADPSEDRSKPNAPGGGMVLPVLTLLIVLGAYQVHYLNGASEISPQIRSTQQVSLSSLLKAEKTDISKEWLPDPDFQESLAEFHYPQPVPCSIERRDGKELLEPGWKRWILE